MTLVMLQMHWSFIWPHVLTELELPNKPEVHIWGSANLVMELDGNNLSRKAQVLKNKLCPVLSMILFCLLLPFCDFLQFNHTLPSIPLTHLVFASSLLLVKKFSFYFFMETFKLLLVANVFFSFLFFHLVLFWHCWTYCLHLLICSCYIERLPFSIITKVPIYSSFSYIPAALGVCVKTKAVIL